MIGKGYSEFREQSTPLLHNSQFPFTEVTAIGEVVAKGSYLCTGGLACGSMIVVFIRVQSLGGLVAVWLPSCSLSRMIHDRMDTTVILGYLLNARHRQSMPRVLSLRAAPACPGGGLVMS